MDENIQDDQRRMLRAWGIRTRKIGRDIGRAGMQDDEILPLLHGTRRSTFFTFDARFYDWRLCHPDYCLVRLDVPEADGASFIRRFLRHPLFITWSARKGKVVHIGDAHIRALRLHTQAETMVAWLL
ncbi:MAG TPA: hypothetical protein VK066_15750 [Chloroflexota bacterium]|nr:hypothetical protein [Chloroflexota bacterium]